MITLLSTGLLYFSISLQPFDHFLQTFVPNIKCTPMITDPILILLHMDNKFTLMADGAIQLLMKTVKQTQTLNRHSRLTRCLHLLTIILLVGLEL